jgi:3-oxoacyl-[acyl-carrier protein] reductase
MSGRRVAEYPSWRTPPARYQPGAPAVNRDIARSPRGLLLQHIEARPFLRVRERHPVADGEEPDALGHARVLGRYDECDRLFAWATSTLGGLDILVNNTVGPPTGGVLEVSDDQWRESFDLIFMSALRLSRAAIPVMREGGGGSIVNLASLTAKQPIDGIALSNALRPALVGMAKTLSREAAPEVRVNNIATEHILTDRIRDIAERIWRQGEESVDDTLWRMALTVPLGRYGTPQELASAVVFLASDAAS